MYILYMCVSGCIMFSHDAHTHDIVFVIIFPAPSNIATGAKSIFFLVFFTFSLLLDKYLEENVARGIKRG